MLIIIIIIIIIIITGLNIGQSQQARDGETRMKTPF